ncbi:MAG TPA: NAD(P)H-hydrate epimerase [Anaerovoracaceae bacterium]|nr:NAD(P)H-hydrate epimerase [Anaerovoracaceae bacterium]
MDREMIFTADQAAADAVTSAQMKEIERNADAAGLSYYQMMENAGSGAAEMIASEHSVERKTVLIFCGRGNNGGDGFVAARKLAEKGAAVRLLLVEGEPRTEDAIKNRQLCRDMAISVSDFPESLETGLFADIEAADLIVDAIYGTGFHGSLRGPARTAARLINRSKAAVYALDIPSGLNADTGEADEDTVRAGCTIVFHRLKPAHANEAGVRYCGRIACISIGIEAVLK